MFSTLAAWALVTTLGTATLGLPILCAMDRARNR